MSLAKPTRTKETMSINTNTWNKWRYTLYAPIYNVIKGVFAHSRQKSIEQLQGKPGQKVLIVGAGTGLDIPYFPEGMQITATDITPAMVNKIQKDFPFDTIEARVMDGLDLQFPDESFDFVVLHLILAVMPHPELCVKEVERVLKPGGRVAVFDKFVPPHTKPTIFRKFGNAITTTLFSDITRDIYEMIKGTSFTAVSDTPANFNGVFRVVLLEK